MFRICSGSKDDRSGIEVGDAASGNPSGYQGIIIPVVCWCWSQVATWMSRQGRGKEIFKRLEVKVDKIHCIITEPRLDIPRWHSRGQCQEPDQKPDTNKNEDKEDKRCLRSRSRFSKKIRYNCN